MPIPEPQHETQSEPRLRRGDHDGGEVDFSGQALLWCVSQEGYHHPHLFAFDDADESNPLHPRTKGLPSVAACARVDFLDEILCPFRYGRNYIVPTEVPGEVWLLELRDVLHYDGSLTLGFIDRVRGPDYGLIWLTDKFVVERRFPGESDTCPIDEFEFDFVPCNVEQGAV